jgi:hypothetical protein
MKCKDCKKKVEHEDSSELCESCADDRDLVWDGDIYVSRYIKCSNCGGYESWCSICKDYTQTCCVDYGTCACS